MEYKITSSGIVISLSITRPTGKVRVKRPVKGFSSQPVACRSEPMQSQDYLEWQISYDTDNLHEPSLVKKVLLHKESGVRYGCELVRLMVEGLKLSLTSAAELKRLNELMKTKNFKGIEEAEQIVLERSPLSSSPFEERFGFVRHQLIVPNYIKTSEKYSVEIRIAHKQKAVGNQAMIFVNLPLEHCASQSGKPLEGRPAEKLEMVDYRIDKSNRELIFDTILAFMIASERHRRDMEIIFSALGL